MKEFFVNERPKSGLKGIKLLNGNAPCHRVSGVTDFPKKEKVKVLPHPPYSPDLAPCDFFLFSRLKKYLSERCYGSRHALGSGIYQCLMGLPKTDFHSGSGSIGSNWVYLVAENNLKG